MFVMLQAMTVDKGDKDESAGNRIIIAALLN